MTTTHRSGGALAVDALLAGVSALVLASLSGAWFGQSDGVMIKWLPNVAAVMWAFHRRGCSLPALLGGHAAGLALAGVLEHSGSSGAQWFHVAADVIETALMILAIRRVSADGRIRRSGDIARIALFGLLLPAGCSATIFAMGLWASGRDWLLPAELWFTASLGVSTIVLMPWLVARSTLRDRPLEGIDPAGRWLRWAVSAGLLGAALAVPLFGSAHEDALVTLLVLMASAWLPLPASAAMFGVVTALHDAQIRSFFALTTPDAGSSPMSDVIRLATIVIAALYVRLLIAESRSASAASDQASRQLVDANRSMAELALRHRLALTAGGIGVWQTHIGTGETEWDDTMFRLFGADRGEGASPRDLMRAQLAPESLALARDALARARRGDDPPERTDYAVQLPDGTTRRIRTVVARMANRNDEVALVGAAWDCSMEYLAAEAMKARNADLAATLEAEAMSVLRARGEVAKAHAAQNDLVANVSHELRTPLHAILGFLDLAQEDLGPTDALDVARARQRIERSQQAAKRLLAQVDDLLDLAKLESGTLALRKRRILLPDLITQVAEEMGPILKARQQRIVVAGPADADLPAEVEADEHRSMQVLRNLLANAARFSPVGGVIAVSVRREANGPGNAFWVVDVRDEGPGIAEADLEAVFAKFVQVRGHRSKAEGGTGLGLTIARQIARAHGGDLRALPSTQGAWLELKLPAIRQD